MTESAAPFDRALLDRRRLRMANATGADFLLKTVADELVDRLSLVQRHFDVAVDLASYGGQLAERLSRGGQAGRIIRIERDLRFVQESSEAVVADEEALPLRDESVDLVVSALSLHLTNDTPGSLIQIRRALRPDGLFLAALLGGESLNELRASLLSAEVEIYGGASPRVAPFGELREVGGLLQRGGFALPVIDQDRLTVRYDTMFDLMRDLRAMGMTNMLHARSRRPVGRRLFLRAAELYAERFADADGRLRATFDVIYLSGWRPHDSQQKPLAPGSAKASLADALKPKGGD